MNVEPIEPHRLLLKDDRAWRRVVSNVSTPKRTGAQRGVRCPLCHWRPSPSSLWSCNCLGSPEPPFPSCGTAWNTFSTRGRCPGCGHQWRWTSCLSCNQPSPHEDWYEERDGD